MMKITIEGARWTPSWETLQHALQEMLEDPDRGAGRGVITSIKRLDGKAGYRECGSYEVNFAYVRRSQAENEFVSLEVK